MARKKLLELALQNSAKSNIDLLKSKIKGLPALIFSHTNPFALYKILQQNKSEASAKAGQTAPKDIVVKAGPTNFVPGPIISELAAVGIKTKVETGKLAIISDVTVAKEGQVISSKVAETLKRLDIKPMEIGLSLVAVWENGLVFEAKQLHIDEAEYLNKITLAASWAMNLAVETAYLTPKTTELLLQKAFREAKALSLEQDIIADATAAEILGKVERQAKALLETAHLPEMEKKTSTEPLEQPSEIKPSLNLTKTESTEPHPELQKKHHSHHENKPITSLEPAASLRNHDSELLNKEAESIIPTAQELIQKTMAANFDKDNQSIRLERAASRAVSAERLVEEELKLARQELQNQAAAREQRKSIQEAEELFQKLKKSGTLRK